MSSADATRRTAARLAVLALVAGLAMGGWPATAAAKGGHGRVTFDSVGPLQFGISTEQDVIAFAGEPDRVADDTNPYSGQANVVLSYGCRGNRCRVSYGINRDDDVLANFATHSRRFRTRAGSRVGTSRRKAARREHGRIRPGCFGETISKSRDGGEAQLYLVFNAKRVTSLSVRTRFGGGVYWDC